MSWAQVLPVNQWPSTQSQVHSCSTQTMPVFRACTSQSSQTEIPGPLHDFKCFKQQVKMLQTFRSSVKTNVHPQWQLLFLPISNPLSRNCNSLQMYNKLPLLHKGNFLLEIYHNVRLETSLLIACKIQFISYAVIHNCTLLLELLTSHWFSWFLKSDIQDIEFFKHCMSKLISYISNTEK